MWAAPVTSCAKCDEKGGRGCGRTGCTNDGTRRSDWPARGAIRHCRSASGEAFSPFEVKGDRFLKVKGHGMDPVGFTSGKVAGSEKERVPRTGTSWQPGSPRKSR